MKLVDLPSNVLLTVKNGLVYKKCTEDAISHQLGAKVNPAKKILGIRDDVSGSQAWCGWPENGISNLDTDFNIVSVTVDGVVYAVANGIVLGYDPTVSADPVGDYDRAKKSLGY